MINKITISELETQKMIDFLEFKNKNELIFCTFCHHEKHTTNKTLCWTTTKKYSGNFSTKDDVKKINNQLQEIISDNNLCGTVSKITCSENCYVVEYTFYPHYILEEKETH